MVITAHALRYTSVSRRRIASNSGGRSQTASDTPYFAPSSEVWILESQKSAYGARRTRWARRSRRSAGCSRCAPAARRWPWRPGGSAPVAGIAEVIAHTPALAVRREHPRGGAPARGAVEVDVGGGHAMTGATQVVHDALGRARPGIPPLGVPFGQQEQLHASDQDTTAVRGTGTLYPPQPVDRFAHERPGIAPPKDLLPVARAWHSQEVAHDLES